MLREFKEFILRGNVLELAVAVIVAGAFGAVVTSLTNDVIMPPVGLALGGVDFSNLALTLQPAEIDPATGEIAREAVQVRYGLFLQKVIDFLIIAFIIFMLIRTYNRVQARFEKKKEETPAPDPGPSEKDILIEIRDLLRQQNR
jgi:large conductance mechanosensitive channel